MTDEERLEESQRLQAHLRRIMAEDRKKHRSRNPFRFFMPQSPFGIFEALARVPMLGPGFPKEVTYPNSPEEE